MGSKTEKEKMLAGELYDPRDPELTEDRTNARRLLKELNLSDEDKPQLRESILKKLLPNSGAGLWLQPPFYCDYGYNIILGEKVFFNFNCVILDVMQVNIGSRSLFGPNVQIYTAMHPQDHRERASGREFAKHISIGADAWIGGSVVICPGVRIGDRSIIGAGSVVVRDIPPDVFAAGNPCEVKRSLGK